MIVDKRDESLKILHVTNSFAPCFDAGGVVRVVYDISKELIAKGHEVTVYTTDGCSKRLDVEKNTPVDMDGIRVYYFRNLSQIIRNKLKIATPYHLLRIIKKEIKNYDVIHIHEHRTILAVMVHHYAKKYNIPYIVQAHGSVLPIFQKGLFKKLFDKVWGFNILYDASKVIALTKTELEQYQEMELIKERVEIVPNGINLSEYQHLPERGKFRKKYGITEDDRVILYLGRINKIKGLDLLIKSFYEISKDLKNIKLVIVGPDDGFMNKLMEMLKKLNLQNNVLVTGPLYNKDKFAAYVDAEVYVLPSIYETFPIAVLEALACGTPVIVTERCGISNLLKNCGIIVEYDEKQLIDSIKLLLDNKDMYAEFKKNGIKLVNEELNWKKIVKVINGLYEEVIEK